MGFMQFVVEFVDFGFDFVESLSAGGRDAVEAATVAANFIQAGLEQAGALQSVKQRVKGAGTDAVAVMLQFLHHGQAEDRLV